MRTEEKQTGIWLDGSKAIIVDLIDGKETVRELASEIDSRVHHKGEGSSGTFMGAHHINDERRFEERKKHEVHQFMNRIIQEVKDSGELFILGPGEMKLALRSKIEGEKSLKNKLVHVQACDYITLNQVVAEIKRFFNEKQEKV